MSVTDADVAPPDSAEGNKTAAEVRVPGELATTLRLRARVLPGGRIDVVSPHLPDGETVEMDIRIPVEISKKPARKTKEIDGEMPGLLAFLDSLPSSSRSPEEWEEFEREFQQERDSWGR